MPLPAVLLLIATLLPLASFTVLVFWGKRLGNPLAGFIGTAAIAGSFVCALIAMFAWLNAGTFQGQPWGAGKGPINIPIAWIPTGAGIAQTINGYMDMGLYVDSLTVSMFLMVTLVATLVHIFSIGYMREDPRFPRFFTYLGLFCFSMLGLVIGGTLLQLFVFWELVGLCSYLLIGFWWEKKSASNAAIKAFVANRIGDFGFLIGFGILFYHVGNATLPSLWAMLGTAGAGGPIMLPVTVPGGAAVFGATALTIMGIGLFCGAMGKSAQFPLHVWLPDAMEGPTPVSALIHAATMVAAGVYLVGRIFPILTPDAKLFIATIGLITLTMAALIAVAQSDIKKVLAYSTVSQLGYMILAMGLGSWMGALFHLITHAFFKALLFLGSGSVINAAHHEQEMSEYGGLFKKIPVTAITFGIGVLAIAGFPYLSGYLSKDTILLHAAVFAQSQVQAGGHAIYWIFFIGPVIVAYLTAFYMARCWMLTFAGKPRNHHLHDHAHETVILWVPLVILALLSVFGGYIGVQGMLRNTIRETNVICKTVDAKSDRFATAYQYHVAGEPQVGGHESAVESATPNESAEGHGEDPKLLRAEELLKFVWPAFLIGIGSAILIYLKGYALTDRFMAFAPFRLARTFLYRKMFIDEFYDAVFIRGTVAVSRLCGLIDKYVVDALVNRVGTLTKAAAFLAGVNDKYVVDGSVIGSAKVAWAIGAVGRHMQSGRIRGYVTIMVLTLVATFVAAMTIYMK